MDSEHGEPGAPDVTERLQAIEGDDVARIKGASGILLGDSYAAALAFEEDATLVVGADPEFGDLSADIDLHQIREEPG